MKLATVVVTRSKSCHVKTLHTILQLNIRCIQGGWEQRILFVNDDPYKKAEMIQDCIKEYDRVLFIDFGIQVDPESLDQVLKPMDGVGMLVFPGVKEGIDWEMFKEKVKSDSKEPVTQMGLYFDTDVGKEVSEDIYTVKTSESRCWVANSKILMKVLRDKKTGVFKISPKMDTMFEKFKQSGVKIHAFIKAKLTLTYGHECIANILHTSGVKST
jgi:hypothetical protein